MNNKLIAVLIPSKHEAIKGLDPKEVERFWRRMADENPNSIRFAGTHPTSAERFLIISKTHSKIALKKQRREKLLPNNKL